MQLRSQYQDSFYEVLTAADTTTVPKLPISIITKEVAMPKVMGRQLRKPIMGLLAVLQYAAMVIRSTEAAVATQAEALHREPPYDGNLQHEKQAMTTQRR